MKALTAAEMREVDRLTTERHGISSLQLMENAGRKAADAALSVIAGRENVRICVLCGKGNNGGDGFVFARYLREQKFPIKVILFAQAEEIRGDAVKNMKRWLDAGEKVEIILNERDWERILPEVNESNVIVDAMLGTGLRGPASGAIARAISDINRLSENATSTWPALILAVDTPSGLPSDGEAATGPVLLAHKTVTFTAPKIGQLVSPSATACGVLEVVDIGSPSSVIEEIGMGSLRWAGPDEFASLPLVRAVDSHKGTFGHVLIVGGSRGKSGAAVLAGYSTLTTGAGLTTIASPDAVQSVIASAHPEYMTEILASTDEGTIAASNLTSGRLAKILGGKTVLAIGPGLGTHPETQQVIRQLVRDSIVPMILDADGLNAFAGELDALGERKSQFLAITPHPGEMGRLLGISNAAVQAGRVKAATETAKRANVHVILKGFHTILAGPDGRVWVNTTGSPALAKGGSGDVLTGVLAALTAQFGTSDWLRVLALGAYLHGAAGAHTGGSNDTSGQLASSVAFAVPMMRQHLLREIQFGG
jgi:NAD(P)H-hydrate epimerase